MAEATDSIHPQVDDDQNTLDEIVERFEDAWQSGKRPSIEEYLSAVGSGCSSLLTALVHVDLEIRIKAGECARVEEYLKRYPELGGDRQVLLELVGAEYELRRRREPRISFAEYRDRFPEYSEQLPFLTRPSETARSAISPCTSVRQSGESESTLSLATAIPAAGMSDPTASVHASAEPTRTRPDTARGAQSTFAGYEILAKLGQGGMGVVYKARQLGLNRLVALKMIRAGTDAGPRELKRFRAEAEAVARLQHPNIVQIYEVAEHDGRPFFSFEYIEGGSLAQRLQDAAMPVRASAEVIETLARAMHVAHLHHIIHRDLKPANILLQQNFNAENTPTEERRLETSREGEKRHSPHSTTSTSKSFTPKITDFGLAKRLDVESGATLPGVVMGTPSYMAPEQAGAQSEQIGPSADIYALGAILYEMLAGRPPFRGDTALDTLQQVCFDEPISPSRLRPNLSRDLETICLKCLQKEPHKRYASALALAEDLRRFLNSEPINARRVGLWERGFKWAKRRPAAATLIVSSTLVAASLLVGVFANLQARTLRAERDQEAAIASKKSADKRIECQNHVLNARQVLAKGDLEPAKLEVHHALVLIKDDVSLADLGKDTEALRMEIEQREREQQARLAEEERKQRARLARQDAEEKWQEFKHSRDKALFLLYAKLFMPNSSPAFTEIRDEVQKVLAFYGLAIDSPSPGLVTREREHKNKIIEDCYVLLLLLAEAAVRDSHGPTLADRRRQADGALRILDRASALGIDSQVYHRRRADYLKLLGLDAAAEREWERASIPASSNSSGLDFLLGEESYKHGKLLQASLHFSSALARDEDNFWARFFLAMCHLQRSPSDQAQARLHLEICCNRRPLSWVYLLRGWTSAAQHEYADAEANYQEALARSGADQTFRYAVYVNRGVLRIQHAEAIGNFNSCVATLPGTTPCAFLAGVAESYRRQRLTQAVADLEAAIGLNLNLFEAHLNLAQAYRQQRKPTEAMVEMDRALRCNPRQTGLYRERARLYLERSDRDAALADLRRAIELEQPSGNFVQLASDYVERGRILYAGARDEEAVEACTAGLKASRDYAAGYLVRAKALARLSRYDEAARDLDECVKRGSATAEALHRRGLVREKLHNWAGAVDDYTRALAITPDAATYADRGWVHLLVSQSPRLALPDFQAALEHDPSRGDAYSGRGFARAWLGQFPQALADAEEALARGPRTPRMLYNTARIFATAEGQLELDPKLRARHGLIRGNYKDRAVVLIRASLVARSAAERAQFWQDIVKRDAALDPIRQTQAFRRLEQDCARKSAE
jgi:serine/threonine protein kinase/Tfp pilus assembly protein PilF